MSFVSQIEKTSRIINDLYTNRNTVFVAVFIVGLILNAHGYCADTPPDMDGLATNIIGKIYESWIRKILAGFSGLWGIFKCYGAQTFSPLILWGGLCAVLFYMPQIINWF